MNDLPAGWTTKKVSELGKILKGKGISKSEVLEKGLPAIRYGELYTKHHNIIKKINTFISEESALKAQKISHGDILLAGSGETPEEIGKSAVYIGNDEAYAGGDIIVLRVENCEPSFLGYALNEGISRHMLTRVAQGSSVIHIYPSSLKEVVVVLPETGEQKKIAKILSSVDRVIELTEVEVKKLKNLKKGMMQDLLTKGIGHTMFKDSPIGKVPRSWDVEKLGDLVKLRHGYQFRDSDFSKSGIKVVKIGNITREGRLDLEGASMISSDRLKDFSNIILKNGDVLMALTGATLGKAAIVRGISEAVLQNYRVGHFSTLDTKILNNDFLYYSLASDLFLRRVLSLINEAAQPNVGKADLEGLYFAVPSTEEQRKIAESLMSLDHRIERNFKKLRKQKNLKIGLMQDLLTGKVRVKV